MSLRNVPAVFGRSNISAVYRSTVRVKNDVRQSHVSSCGVFMTRQSLRSQQYRFLYHDVSATEKSQSLAMEISKLVHEGSRDAGSKAEALLKTIERQAKDDPKMDLPSTPLYNQVISLYGRAGNGEESERILRKMQRLVLSGENPRAEPDSVTYTACISAWSSCRQPGSAKRAENMLHEMVKIGAKVNKYVKPESDAFNAVISAYVREHKFGGVSNVLQLMMRFAQQPKSNVKINTITLSSVIRLLAKRKRKDASLQAKAILNRMETLYYREGNESVKPDAITYAAFIETLGNAGEKNADDRALQVLQRMERLYRERMDFSVKPDTVVFNAVLAVIAKSGKVDCGDKAQSILQLMHHRYDAGNPDVRPSVVSYSTTMLAWQNSGDTRAAYMAEALLRKMQQRYHAGDDWLEPNTTCFSAVISTLAKSKTTGAAQRSEFLLDEMLELFRAGNTLVQPNTVTYATVIEAWAETGDSEALSRIEKLINKMEDRAKNEGTRVGPNAVTYNSWIKAVEKSDVGNKADKVVEIIERMRSDRSPVTPNIRTYNSAFQACAAQVLMQNNDNQDEVKQKALDVSLRLFDDLKKNQDVKPDFYTYPAISKACANLFTGDVTFIKKVFRSCCADGMVDLMVLSHIRRVAPDFLRVETGIDAKSLRLEHLPRKWVYRIRKQRKHKK